MSIEPHPLTDVIGDALHIVEVDGTTYATDTYWMAPLSPEVVDLLRWWNLEPTPGRYEFDYLDDPAGCDECGQGDSRGPLRRQGEPAAAEKFTNIIDNLAGNSLRRLRTDDGLTLYVLNKGTGKPLAVFTGIDNGGSTFSVYANPEYLRLAFGDWEADSVELRCSDPKSPIWMLIPGSTACVMPVRMR